MIETLMQQFAGFLLCLVIIILTEPNINRMDRRAPLLLRLGLWALCVAAAARHNYSLRCAAAHLFCNGQPWKHFSNSFNCLRNFGWCFRNSR